MMWTVLQLETVVMMVMMTTILLMRLMAIVTPIAMLQ